MLTEVEKLDLIHAAIVEYKASAPPPTQYSTSDAAKVLGISTRTLVRMRLPRNGCGKIPYEIIAYELAKAKDSARDEHIKDVRGPRLPDRTPRWADQRRIRRIYAAARRLSKETGIPHHVDHVIPLRGYRVSGLHVHENLRIVTAKENIAKGNHFDPEWIDG